MNEEKLLEWDYVRGIFKPHLSFLLYHYLPYCKTTQAEDQDKANKLYLIQKEVEVLPTGSFMEGLRLPPILKKNADGNFTSIAQSDVDMMIVGMSKYVGERTHSGNYPIRYHLRTENMQPGYTLLEIGEPDETAEVFKEKIFDKNYLSAEKVTAMLHGCVKVDQGQQASIQGPAVTFYIPGTETRISTSTDIDGVHALFIPEWPNIAKEWLERKRASHWPPQETISDIAKKGCHVVAKGHPYSKTMGTEWRFSFSFAEAVLAKNLTKIQVQCYLLLKLLHTIAFKVPKGIVSYHLKTLFYWTAEEIPQQLWTVESTGEMLVLLLDKLLHCLVKHDLPSYFIPSNNLIDAVPKEVIKVIKGRVLQVCHNPLKYLLAYNKYHKFQVGPILSDLNEVFQPVIEHGQNWSNASCQMNTCISDVFMPTAISLTLQHLGDFQKMRMAFSDIDNQSGPIRSLEAALNVAVDVCRLVRKINCPDAHPAVMFEHILPHLSDNSAVVELCLFLIETFPNTPNKETLLQIIVQKTLNI